MNQPWVSIEPTKERHSFLPDWSLHIMITFSFGSLIIVSLIVGESKNEAPLVRMIQTHKIFKSSLKLTDSNFSPNETPKKFFLNSRRTKRYSSKPAKDSMTLHPIQAPINLNGTEANKDKSFIQESNIEAQPSVIEKIRNDPKRIYLGKRIMAGDIVFEFRNASEYGIELYVRNDDVNRTYYFPKVVINGEISSFDGSVLLPGTGSYGWIIVPDLRKKNKIVVEMSVAGSKKVKDKLNLDW